MNKLFQDETNEKVEVVSSSSDKLKKKIIYKSLNIFYSLIQLLYLKGYCVGFTVLGS